MKFQLHCIGKNQAKVVYEYDNELSTLTKDGVSVVPVTPAQYDSVSAVSDSQPGRKFDVDIVKISLGLSCNYSCSYCNQRFVEHADSTTQADIDAFVDKFVKAIKAPPNAIEFWGGEPLVYWKTLKPLAERLRQLYPTTVFKMVTNGSLLDLEKNAWIDSMGFTVGLSHDGPGYAERGVDPLDDPEKRAAILDLYARLKGSSRISINAMLHKSNQSRKDIQRWLQGVFGQDVPIGEGFVVDPYDDGGAAASLVGRAAQIEFSTRAFGELRRGYASNFGGVNQKIVDFVNSIKRARPAAAVGQKCGMDSPHTVTVDLNGNVVTCQNTSAAAVAMNGKPHRIGSIADLEGVLLNTATSWSQRPDCASCPVLQLCKGSCMFLQGELWDLACGNSFADNIATFAAAIEYLTGDVVVYIDGDFREDRKDIFGQINGVPDEQPKKVISIKAV